MLLYTFGMNLDLFPLQGMHTLGHNDPGDLALHLVLPVASLTIQQVAGWSRYMRASMLEVMRQDYIRTARAKGLSSGRVLRSHAIPNALLPAVTLVAINLGYVVGGAITAEIVFNWPGLGHELVTYLANRDYAAVQGIVIVFALVVVIVSLIIDFVNAYIDPRIRY
jgi:peptide/nickel transport system permease protein